MHIKKITIQGFKTYKSTTVIDVLSPNFNVVLGRNGLGKSNFFAAIRFVLSDAYTHMTREERQGLIHEGSGTILSAFVEIIFDNHDRRFPLPKDEIAIRRTIGLKKDDYSLDGKSVTRSDVMNLLESAGFSRLNPYYIVPQGRITSLTNSKDTERLQLLKEVSGAKMFESKLRESTKEMSTSNFKMERIDESMQKLDEKLADLQSELDELKEYRQLERDKKTIEFHLVERELKTLTTQIESKEDDYEVLLNKSLEIFKALEKRELQCLKMESTLADLSSSLKIATVEKSQLEPDFTRLLLVIAEKEVYQNDSSNTIATTREKLSDCTDRMDLLTSKVSKKRLQIKELAPKLQKEQSTESTLKNQLAQLSLRQRLLLSKQSRLSEHKTREERDMWLENEISTLQKDMEAMIIKAKDANSSISAKKSELQECSERLEAIKVILDNPSYHQQQQQLENDVKQSKSEFLHLSELKRALLMSEMRLKSLYDSTEHELSLINSKAAKSIDSSISKALDSVVEITERLNLQESVFGPLVELFTVPDKYKTAVEVVAGNSLFHVVVDTDETALVLVKELNRLKGGRITFMPLNRMSNTTVSFPEQQEHEFIPLIKKIKHHESVSKAIQQVFGKTIVCNNLQRGSQLSVLHGLNAITLDGDRASTKGVLSGGFRETRNSRLDNLKIQGRKRRELKKLQTELLDLTTQLAEASDQVANSNRRCEEVTDRLTKHRSSLEAEHQETSRLQKQKLILEKDLSGYQETYDSLDSRVLNIKAEIRQYEEEKSSEFQERFTHEEESELISVNEKISHVEQDLNNSVTLVTEIEAEMTILEDEISRSEIHIQKIKEEIVEDEVSGVEFDLQMITDEIQVLKSQAASIENQLNVAISKEDALQKEVEKVQNQLNKANGEQTVAVQKLENVGKKAEKLLSQKAILSNRKDDLLQRIGKLGVLPEEAFEQGRFGEVSDEEMLGNLQQICTELKRFAHINKKAMEQLSTFAQEREELVLRKEELEQSRESIERLVTSLKEQKDMAIFKSFQEVSKGFSDIFEKLVPAGKGELVMVSRADGQQTQAEKERAQAEREATLNEETLTGQDSSVHSAPSVDNFTGVSIRVSFNSKENEQQQIEQLSGGQKSLCAIALILAIQRCDPAPFYLFDEIDANLDTQYRTAVVGMIKSLAVDAQFICTTFRPEMIMVADKFYGVSFKDRVSTISEIVQDDGLQFVESQR